VFVDHLSWRWVFYVNVPIGLAALVLLRRQPAAATQGNVAHRLPRRRAVAAAPSAPAAGHRLGGDRYAWGSRSC